MKLIALTGFAGVGKNTAADGLIGWQQIAFADPLREMLYTLNPIVNEFQTNRLQDLVDQLGWDKAKRKYSEIRRLLQVFGTEVMRGMMDDEIWLKIGEGRLLGHCRMYEDPIVFTDVRFENEAEMIRKYRGLIVRITRPGYEAVNGHASEAQEISADETIVNDGTIAELYRKINEAANLIPDRVAVG